MAAELRRLARLLAADGAHHGVFGARVVDRQLVLRTQHFVVFRHRRDRRFRHHVNDLEAAGFQLTQQFGHRFGGGVLEVVHQHNALATLLQLGRH